MLVVSCNAWLDVTPENAIADDDLFSTGFGYRNALNGIYTNLASDELYGKQLSWGFLKQGMEHGPVGGQQVGDAATGKFVADMLVGPFPDTGKQVDDVIR